MSSVCRIAFRQVNKTQQFVRFVSSQQYIPGRKGYAPGFEAPEGTRESPKPIHKRREIATSLTSHLPGQKGTIGEQSESVKKIYRQELKVTRHKYARELLEKQGQKELASAEKLAQTEVRAQKAKQLFQEAKEQQKQHEEQVVKMLSLDNNNNNVDNINNRDERRIQNRLQLEEAQRNTRHAKVDAVISTEGRSFHESLTELMHNSASVQLEIEQRKAQLKEVMGV
ncbi:unnamed protein product [Mucor hiemalis]